jgi:lipoprotein NlpD
LAWPAAGALLAGFAEGSSKGLDIAGKTGEPVHAAAAGKVILVSNALRGYGNFVIIKHNNLYLSVYAHNSRILVKEEQTVSKGQKIAEIGSSDADVSKLHFEIRRQGKPVDPARHLPAR